MDCQTARKIIKASEDQKVPEDQRLEAVSHVQNCTICSAEFSEYAEPEEEIE